MGQNYNKLDSIEAGRGIAAVAVVLYHAARHVDKARHIPPLARLFQFGHAGVDFFFVISGFIILFVHYNDIDRPGRALHYAERRLTRVMPTYWVALAATIVLSLAGGQHFPSIAAFAQSILLLPSNHPPILGIAWTLQYEIAFYIVFCVLIFNRMAGIVLLASWLVVIASTSGFEWALVPKSLYGAFNLEFFLGMGVAWYLRNGRLRAPWTILLIGIVLFSTMATLENIGRIDGYADWARFAYGIPAAVIVAGAAECSRQGTIRIPNWLRVCGGASYSIYLFQFLFIGIIWNALVLTNAHAALNPVLLFCLLASGAIVGGIIVSRRVEQPLIQFSRRRIASLGFAPGHQTQMGASR